MWATLSPAAELVKKPAAPANPPPRDKTRDATETKGWLGAIVRDMTPGEADERDFATNEGALIKDVIPGGPAANAGLQKNDVILQFGGTKITTAQSLIQLVGTLPPGSVVEVIALHGKKKWKYYPMLEDLVSGKAKLLAFLGATRLEEFGMTVHNLTPETLETTSFRGVAVAEVDPQGSAFKDGLQNGDLIERMGDTPVHSVEEFRQLIEQKKQNATSALLYVRRGNSSTFIYLRLAPTAQ